jgi:hypothetical protein
VKFEKAVANGAPVINSAYRAGLTALGVDSKKVTSKDPHRFTGSISLDVAFKATQPTSHRWDYGIGYVSSTNKEVALWVEVHPAETSEIYALLQKLTWLKSVLNDPKNAHLKELTKAANSVSLEPFHWIASKGVDIRPTTKQEKMLRMAGLGRPKAHLNLP